MWTIFNSLGQAVANCDIQPNFDDLTARGERAVCHAEAIPLEEIMLVGDDLKRKTKVGLTATICGLTATITVSCDDSSVTEIPLLINDVAIVKTPGEFVIYGEPGIGLTVETAAESFCMNRLEVVFNV